MQFIEAKDKNLADVLTNNRYKIDSFQREYRWQRKHIEALISDLCICFDKYYNVGDTIESYENYDGYYMGPIVLCDDKKSISIVDGQQRLTSFTLLLIFLHHAQKRLGLEENRVKDLKQFLYVTKGGKTTLVLNVESRNEVIEHLYNNPDQVYEIDENLRDESILNLIDRYEDITKLFPEEFTTIDKLPIFIEWMLDKIVMVEVKAYSMEHAYTIFETMNDRGLSLNPTEILKGFLLSKIENEEKSEAMNDFWKKKISELNSVATVDSDLDFFRAWLRAKYAQTIRPTKSGAENEDFEIIGTQFHSWVKNNLTKTYLKESDNYYYFIRSDFEFFVNLYMKIYSVKNSFDNEFSTLYYSNFYPVADSLSYPLLMSSITKNDSPEIISKKINIVSKFLDVYTIRRVVTGRSITQSTIRYNIYDLVKSIRDKDVKSVYEILSAKIEDTDSDEQNKFFIMDNWGFYHYLFARILHKYSSEEDFNVFLRSRKKNSYILFKILDSDESIYQKNPIIQSEMPKEFLKGFFSDVSNTVYNYCLVRRNDVEKIKSYSGVDRITYLLSQKYMPEMSNPSYNTEIDFFTFRILHLGQDIESLTMFDV